MPHIDHGHLPPPEHIIHPIKRGTKEATLLRRVGEQLHAESTDFFKELQAGEMSMMRPFADRASGFSLKLADYWHGSIQLASERYLLEHAGEKAWLDKQNVAIADVSPRIESALSKWTDVTSPFTDHYDEGAIYSAARLVLDAVRAGSERVREDPNEKRAILADKQLLAETIFNHRIHAALTGISDIVGNRLIQVADGKVVPVITIPAQTKETIDRARLDPEADVIRKLVEDAQKTNDDLDRKWKLTKAELAAALAEPARKDIRKLDGYVDKAVRKPIEKTQLDTARAELKKVQTVIASDDGLPADKRMPAAERSEVEENLKTAAARLADLEYPYLEGMRKEMEQDLKDAQARADAYRQSLADAKTAIGGKLGEFWRKTKSNFMDDVEAATDGKLREALDKVFDAGFGSKLDNWGKLLGADSLLLADAQSLASEILLSADSYSGRVAMCLRSENADLAVVQEAADSFNAALAALRGSVAQQLENLLKS
jgi:hypothetical protein